MGKNWVQFKVMFRKDWLQMTAEKKKLAIELLFTIAYSVFIGYQISNQLENEEIFGLGYLILLLLSPVIFESSTKYVANQMVRDRETKMKETLKIMGMESWVYATGFMVMRGIWMTIPVLLVVIFIWLFNKTELGDGILVYLFLLLWLFGAAMLTFTLFVQNLFSSPNLVSMVLPFLFFIPVGLAMTIILGPILTGVTNEWI